KEFPVPTGSSYPSGITTGPDGNLWFTEFFGGKIGQFLLPSYFGVAAFLNSVPAGVAVSVTVTARDASNTPATSYRGTVHFTSSDGTATLPGNYAFTAADNGVHTFSVTLRTAG